MMVRSANKNKFLKNIYLNTLLWPKSNKTNRKVIIDSKTMLKMIAFMTLDRLLLEAACSKSHARPDRGGMANQLLQGTSATCSLV